MSSTRKYIAVAGNMGSGKSSLVKFLCCHYKVQPFYEPNEENPYLKDFWTRTFPSYPAGSCLPLANRLNRFLRMPQVRAALCHPVSSFSIQRALNENVAIVQALERPGQSLVMGDGAGIPFGEVTADHREYQAQYDAPQHYQEQFWLGEGQDKPAEQDQ